MADGAFTSTSACRGQDRRLEPAGRKKVVSRICREHPIPVYRNARAFFLPFCRWRRRAFMCDAVYGLPPTDGGGVSACAPAWPHPPSFACELDAGGVPVTAASFSLRLLAPTIRVSSSRSRSDHQKGSGRSGPPGSGCGGNEVVLSSSWIYSSSDFPAAVGVAGSQQVGGPAKSGCGTAPSTSLWWSVRPA